MIRSLRAAVFAVAASAALCGPAAAQPDTRRDVSANFEVRDGALALRFDAIRGRFVVDPRALRFSLRPYSARGAGGQARPIDVVAGAPVYSVPVELGPVHRDASLHRMATVPLTLPAAAPPPGMYELLVDAADDVVRTPARAALPMPFERGPLSIAVWWPDERDGDAGLRYTSARFANRVVHGYGGISVGCPGSWGEQHPPEPGVRLAGVTRENGTVALLRAGSLRTSGADGAFEFVAVDPLVLQIANAKGVPYRKSDKPGSCDLVWRFADPWHVDTALTTANPPRLTDPRWPELRDGMTRDEVVWRAGYPSAYGTAAQLRAQDVWRYEAGPLSFAVTFEHDRVVGYHPPDPGRLPG